VYNLFALLGRKAPFTHSLHRVTSDQYITLVTRALEYFYFSYKTVSHHVFLLLMYFVCNARQSKRRRFVAMLGYAKNYEIENYCYLI